MHCSWELNKKKYYFTPFFIKIIFLFSFLFSSYSSLSLSHITSLYSLKPKLLSLSSHRLGPALTCRWSCPYLCKSHPCCCPWIHLAQSSTPPTHRSFIHTLSLGLVGLYHCFCKIDNNSNRSFLSVFREKNHDHRFLILWISLLGFRFFAVISISIGIW